VAKAAALELPVDPAGERHETDFVFLLTLVAEPFVLRDEVSRNEVKLLRRASAKLPVDHAAWREADDPDLGLTALSILTSTPA
jgi:hypothetical protein